MFFFDPWIKGTINFLAKLILSSSFVILVKRTSSLQLFLPNTTPYSSFSYNPYQILSPSKYIQNLFGPMLWSKSSLSLFRLLPWPNWSPHFQTLSLFHLNPPNDPIRSANSHTSSPCTSHTGFQNNKQALTLGS